MTIRLLSFALAAALISIIPAVSPAQEGSAAGTNSTGQAQRERSKADRAKGRQSAEPDSMREQGDELSDEVRPRQQELLDGDNPILGKDMGAERADAESKGNTTAREMRSRRDERKTMMDEHKGTRDANPDDEDPQGVLGSAEDATDQSDEGEQEKAKKPWWKFWET